MTERWCARPFWPHHHRTLVPSTRVGTLLPFLHRWLLFHFRSPPPIVNLLLYKLLFSIFGFGSPKGWLARFGSPLVLLSQKWCVHARRSMVVVGRWFVSGLCCCAWVGVRLPHVVFVARQLCLFRQLSVVR